MSGKEYKKACGLYIINLASTLLYSPKGIDVRPKPAPIKKGYSPLGCGVICSSLIMTYIL